MDADPLYVYRHPVFIVVVIVFPQEEVANGLTTGLKPLKTLPSLVTISWDHTELKLWKSMRQTSMRFLPSKLANEIPCYVHQTHTEPCSSIYRDLELVFTPLPGAVIDDDYLYPASDLFILPGFPVCHSSMIRHGQLPPLHYNTGVPSPLSYTVLNAATNGLPIEPFDSISSRPTTALSTGWMDGSMNERLDLDEGIIMPSRKENHREK